MTKAGLRRPLFFVLMTASALALAWFFYTEQRSESGALAPAPTTRPFGPKAQPGRSRPWPWQKPRESAAAQLDVDDLVKDESQAMGRADANPQATLERLMTIAARLQASELEQLKGIALDMARGGDERFLAAYVMSLSGHETTLTKLKELATSPLPNQKLDPRLYDQEVMIRAQALEGIARAADGQNHLKDFLSRQDNVTLAQHAQRLLQSSRH